VHDSENPKGEIVIVNTCGFIADAKQESIELLLELGELKAAGEVGAIYVMGCLSERYKDVLPQEMPEIDRWYGKFNWSEIIETLPDRSSEKRSLREWERNLTTPRWSAYLKISEGCNRFCSFCAIPLITGRHTSRPIEEIVEEVKALVADGVKEFNIIAQDLSSYGTDLYGHQSLARLIETISDIQGVEWIRLHYAYPADFPFEILKVMRERENVCNYLDIALQHIADPVLSNMRRHITAQQTRSLLERIRKEVPDIRLRTTLMVGFPGEGENEFRELLDFVREQKFDRMGAFAYSEEEDTWGAKNLDDTIPEEIKQKRLDTLMQLQEDIALENNTKMVGKTYKVLVERQEGENAIGRTEYDSPEVDPEVIIKGCRVRPGEFINVRITEAYPYELIGEVAD
ncbi:MAG: 30S ribosomal protein S12 methylthiotransferase RimO, partial [Muribaculaceae bacterium]|nr:30S ribosomal protein S12 methylthiotransferase RimO [Muribaculaceae bacterium]